MGAWGGAGGVACTGHGRLQHQAALCRPPPHPPAACALSPPAGGPLFAPVKPDDCLWSLSDAAGGGGRQLELQLAKLDGMQWWKAVVAGDPEIDVQAVEPESSKLTDLGGRRLLLGGSSSSSSSAQLCICPHRWNAPCCMPAPRYAPLMPRSAPPSTHRHLMPPPPPPLQTQRCGRQWRR